MPSFIGQLADICFNSSSPTCTALQVNAEASFTSTLGLDSLDAVEVVMAIEEEFNIVSASATLAFAARLGMRMREATAGSPPIPTPIRSPHCRQQEIPDADADAIQTVGQAIEYISKTPEGEFEAPRERCPFGHDIVVFAVYAGADSALAVTPLLVPSRL